MGIEARLSKLEAAQPETFLGWRTFNTADGANYYEVTRGDYATSLLCADGNNPADRRAWTQAELDAIQAEGWKVSVVRWAKDWYESAGFGAVHQDTP